jgi:phosphatidylinositol alpha-mannosyltransferase
MTIGFVLDDSLDKTDGVQQYVLTLGNWLAQNGHTVHYLVGETKRRDISHLHSLIDSVVVPNAVDALAFRNARPLFLSDNKKHIVFLGRLVDRKGCDYLLRAVKRLVELGEKDIIADICGKGEMEAGLKEYVMANGLEPYVKFHGFVSEEDKPRILAGADIAVFPSTGGESFGIVLIEAMAAGARVVIGGDNPGYATVLRHEQLFNPRSIRGFAQLMYQYLHDDQAITAANVWQRHAIKQYDVTNVGHKVLAVYQEALHRRSA